MRPDVIVVGLGSMGASATYQLAHRGVRVLGLDRFTPPHGRGAHAGGSRIIRFAYAEGPDYVPLLQRTDILWRAVEEEAGVELVTRTGGLNLGPPGGMIAGGALISAQQHGLDHALLDAAEVRRRFPVFSPGDDEVAVYEDAAGLVRPEAAITAYLRLATAAGAQVRYGVPVTGWQADSGGVTVQTADGPLSADRLVLCPGAWAPQLLTDLAVPLRVERRVQHYFQPPDERFEPGQFPVWIWEYLPGAAAYGLPALAGGDFPGGVKAAFHQLQDPADADVGAAEATPAEGDEVRVWLSTRLPLLAASEWLGGKQCLYTLTPDEHFMLGRHPVHPQVAMAAGFSGHGFKFVPVVGEILADLTVHGVTEQPIGLFDPARFG